MAVQQFHDPLGVPCAQRLEDLPVFGERLGDPVGVGVHDGDAHAELAVAELVVEAGEDLVAAAAHDLGVEAAVGDRRLGQFAGGDLLALPGEQFLQPGQERGRRGHRLARRVRLDEPARLDHVRDLLGGDGQDQGALLRVEAQQSLDLQPQQCLPHGGARDADLLGQATLGQQCPALVAALQHTLLDVGVHPVGGRGPLAGRGGREGEGAAGTGGWESAGPGGWELAGPGGWGPAGTGGEGMRTA